MSRALYPAEREAVLADLSRAVSYLADARHALCRTGGEAAAKAAVLAARAEGDRALARLAAAEDPEEP